jgi:hypothetical protein
MSKREKELSEQLKIVSDLLNETFIAIKNTHPVTGAFLLEQIKIIEQILEQGEL